MHNVIGLRTVKDDALRITGGLEDRLAKRFLRDLRMCGYPADIIAEILRIMLEYVEPRERQGGGSAA